MTVTFTILDWVWVGLFLLLMIGSGVLFYRLGKRSKADFFLAGRGLPWWLPASSVYATHTATDTPMWITGVIYQHGMAGIWYTFSPPGPPSAPSFLRAFSGGRWPTRRRNGTS